MCLVMFYVVGLGLHGGTPGTPPHSLPNFPVTTPCPTLTKASPNIVPIVSLLMSTTYKLHHHTVANL